MSFEKVTNSKETNFKNTTYYNFVNKSKKTSFETILLENMTKSGQINIYGIREALKGSVAYFMISFDN